VRRAPRQEPNTHNDTADMPRLHSSHRACLHGERSCETNPIRHRSTGRGAGGKKRKSLHRRGRMRQTNPIGTGTTSRASPVWTRNYGELDMQMRLAKQSQSRPRRAGRDLGDEGCGGQSCQTKPNLGGLGYLGAGVAGANRATSPRCPASGNKANFSIADCGLGTDPLPPAPASRLYKQSQLGEV
jgi:hypothetical protein